MEKLLRPGTGSFLKIKLPAKRLGTSVVLAVWLLSILACSQQSYISSYDLTATAMFAPKGSGGGEILPEPVNTELPTVQPGQTEISQVVEVVIPTQPQVTEADTPTPTPTIYTTPLPPVLYYAQAGDTLSALAVRYGVAAAEITSPQSIPERGLISPGQLLVIPNRLIDTGPVDLILPDSEIVYSPSALDFDIKGFVQNAGGYLSSYKEYVNDSWKTGAEVIYKVAIENSINPRLLLAVLELQSGWVYGQPSNIAKTDYPMGWVHVEKKGLYKQLSWAVQQFSIGYYGWRDGLLTELPFADGNSLRLAPNLNAGTVAVQYLFAQLYDPDRWNGVLYGVEGMGSLYERMFDNPWIRAQTVEPLLPINLTQPDLILPFLPGHTWSYTGGPHSAWGPDGARAALDFAPASVESGCVPSEEWITAVASGVITRSENGVVVLDLDGDGYEQTGWAILYLHVANQNRIAVGTWVAQGDLIGHPSCEGGVATGTHVHIARKYNGEWVLADGSMSFTLNGYAAIAGAKPYEGSLKKDGEVIDACTCGSYETRITRPSQ